MIAFHIAGELAHLCRWLTHPMQTGAFPTHRCCPVIDAFIVSTSWFRIPNLPKRLGSTANHKESFR